MGRRRFVFLVSIAMTTGALCTVGLRVVDVTNDAEPSSPERWLASHVFQMKVRAQKPQHPVHFATTEDDLERASSLYQQMCAVCHGGSRGRMAPFAKSFSPRPPQFVIQASARPTWMDAYVIQHGVRWTGMPSFHGLPEADAWHLALYVEGRSQPRD